MMTITYGLVMNMNYFTTTESMVGSLWENRLQKKESCITTFQLMLYFG